MPRYIFLLLLAAICAACTIEGTSSRNASIHGSIIDADTKKYVAQDISIENGTKIVLESLADASKTATLSLSSDGTYECSGISAGQYRVTSSASNFFPIEDIIDIKSGDNELDIKVLPYVRITVDSINFHSTNCRVYAYFKLETPGGTSLPIDNACLFADTAQDVSESISEGSSSLSIGKIWDSSEEYCIVMSTGKMQTKTDYYFRIGAIIGNVTQATYNYATAKKIRVDNSKYDGSEDTDPKYILDNCDSSEGWGSGVGTVTTDVNSREGSACISVSGNATGTVFFQKSFDETMDTHSSASSGQLSFYLYLSDASIIPRDGGQIELSSSGTCDVNELSWSWSHFIYASGWNKVTLPMAKGSFTNGSFDFKNCNWFRMYNTKASGEITMKLDKVGFYSFK